MADAAKAVALRLPGPRDRRRLLHGAGSVHGAEAFAGEASSADPRVGGFCTLFREGKADEDIASSADPKVGGVRTVFGEGKADEEDAWSLTASVPSQLSWSR
eukprot:CAMPEP_0172907714 /NCGR_PEP_ID=MMETSP1075-20121228/179386_1 /TAXON_ID=2916 /ORGANISM="Ceratium fusus, Strain PA161109" /LENGTH=101 /DNA_ID=CAMNT_0013765379 /DNA_START=230 /DNA_END=535 /DNA_ORIENTATION=+